MSKPVDMFTDTDDINLITQGTLKQLSFSKGEIDSKRIRVEFPLDDMGNAILCNTAKASEYLNLKNKPLCGITLFGVTMKIPRFI